MIKTPPSLAKVAAMVVFTLSCFAILTFLWVSFGGPVPLGAKGYEVKAAFPQAAQLADEADVRIAGVNVGKVKTRRLAPGGAATIATLAIDPAFAPLPRSTHAILRQKTLLGETYVELTPGSRRSGTLPDGTTLPSGQVQPSVQLDQILQVFDSQTRGFMRQWIQQGARAVAGRGADLNAVLGNLPGFAQNGSALLAVLDAHDAALRRLISRSGAVFAALNRRGDELQQLILNSDRLFSATQAQRSALADIFHIFPTFLDESRLTLARTARFSQNTQPLVDELRPVASELPPALDQLNATAAPLKLVFRDLPPVVSAARPNIPQGVRYVKALPPLLTALHAFLPELNPILSYSNFARNEKAQYMMAPGAGSWSMPPTSPGGPRRFYLNQFGVTDQRSLALNATHPPWERANSYIAPNAALRSFYLGALESFDKCRFGERFNADPQNMLLPCLAAPPSLWDGKEFSRIARGEAPLVDNPQGLEGTKPIPTNLPPFGP